MEKFSFISTPEGVLYSLGIDMNPEIPDNKKIEIGTVLKDQGVFPDGFSQGTIEVSNDKESVLVFINGMEGFHVTQLKELGVEV